MSLGALLPCLFAGEEKALEVQEPESAEGEYDEEEEEERGGEADQAAGAEEEEPLPATDESRDLPESCKPKMKLFTGKSAAGLRIRSEPSRIVSQIFLRGNTSMDDFNAPCSRATGVDKESFFLRTKEL